MRLGIIANTTKTQIGGFLPGFLAWLNEHSINFTVADDIHLLCNISDYTARPACDVAEDADFMLSFGGDGTFLQTARLVVPHNVPIIGVNFGGFGYLAEVQYADLTARIDDLRENKYTIEKRMMLSVCLGEQDDNKIYYGLNDIVVDKGSFPRAINLVTHLDNEYLNTFTADGLIVATPTGSTGYSLSAGGPILEPEVDALIMIPICPHMLAHRPLVISKHRKITITAASESGYAAVIVDGQRLATVETGRTIQICVANAETEIVNFSDHSFYGLLRNKLQWRHQ